MLAGDGSGFPNAGARIAVAAILIASCGGGAVLADQPTDQTSPRLHSPWISCSEMERVAYRAVPPALNVHNMFLHPIKVALKPGQSCADLK
jgi:hypothetical protein